MVIQRRPKNSDQQVGGQSSTFDLKSLLRISLEVEKLFKQNMDLAGRINDFVNNNIFN